MTPDDPSPDDNPYGFPFESYLHGEPVPDLARIEQSRWREVLAPLHARTRNAARRTLKDDFLAGGELVLLIDSLAMEDQARRQAAMAAAHRGERLPAPDGPGLTSIQGRWRQVNVRLSGPEWQDLSRAADLVGARPTQLARIFIVSGTRRALHEHARAVKGSPHA